MKKNKILNLTIILVVLGLIGLVFAYPGTINLISTYGTNTTDENITHNFEDMYPSGYSSYTTDWRINNNSLYPLIFSFEEGTTINQGQGIRGYGDYGGGSKNGVLINNTSLVPGFIGNTYDLYNNPSVAPENDTHINSIFFKGTTSSITTASSRCYGTGIPKSLTVMFWYKDEIPDVAETRGAGMISKWNGDTVWTNSSNYAIYDLYPEGEPAYKRILFGCGQEDCNPDDLPSNKNWSYQTMASFELDSYDKRDENWHFMGFTLDVSLDGPSSYSGEVMSWIDDDVFTTPREVHDLVLNYCNSTADLTIGAMYKDEEAYKGLIDEVRFLNYAVDKETIQEIYKNDLKRRSGADEFSSYFTNTGDEISALIHPHYQNKEDDSPVWTEPIDIRYQDPVISVKYNLTNESDITVYGNIQRSFNYNSTLTITEADGDNRYLIIIENYSNQPVSKLAESYVTKVTLPNYVYINTEGDNVEAYTQSFNNASLEIIGKPKDDLIYYNITSTITYNSTSARLTLKDNLTTIPEIGDIIYIHNYTLPTGWFNVSRNNAGQNTINTNDGSKLFSGGNIITYRLSDYYSNTLNVYYDNINPWINTTHTNGESFLSTDYFYFNISDDYGINTTETYINFSDTIYPNHFENYTLEYLLNDDEGLDSASIRGGISPSYDNSCEVITEGKNYTCALRLVDLNTSSYDVNISVKELVNRIATVKEFTNIQITEKPLQPIIQNLEDVTGIATIDIYGLARTRSVDNVTVYISNGTDDTYVTSSPTIAESDYICSGVVADNHYEIGETSISLDNTTCGVINNSVYIKFQHNKSNYTFYDITNPIIGDERPDITTITLAEGLEQAITEEETYYIYSGPTEDTRFNISNVPLLLGNNTIYVQTKIGEIENTENSTQQYVFYDTINPSIIVSSIPHDYNIKEPTFTFTITDNYGVNLTKTNLTIKNATLDTNLNLTYVWNQRDDVADYDGNFTCAGTPTSQTCTFSNNFVEDGNYTLRFYTKDQVDNYRFNKREITIKTEVQDIDSVSAVGTDSAELYINVSWLDSTPDPYLENYSISVQLENNTIIVPWFNVSKDEPQPYKITSSNFEINKEYFVHVRPVDSFGNIGNSTNSSGVILEDFESPIINLSKIEEIYTTWTPTLQINLTDNYKNSLNNTIVYLNSTDGQTNLTYVWNQRDDVADYDGNFSSFPNLDNFINLISPKINLTRDATYNLTVFTKDYFNNLAENSTLVKIKTFVIPASNVRAKGYTNYVDVNWTNSTDDDLSHYNVSIIELPSEEVIAYAVTTENSTSIEGRFEINTLYIASVVAVDIYNNTAEPSRSNNILITDTLGPEKEYIRILDYDNTSYWNYHDTLNLEWLYTDNLSGINQYQYAIGTSIHPDRAEDYAYAWDHWDDVLPATNSTFTSASPEGLDLIDGESYYLSVRAQDNQSYWSLWDSSDAITIDVSAPTGGSISYPTGFLTTSDSITITYVIGNDSISGLKEASVWAAKVQMNNDGQCPGFVDQDFNHIRSISEEEIASIDVYAQQNLIHHVDNGYCYKFKLDVSDNVDNKETYTYATSLALKVDTTPPTPVVFDMDYVYTTSPTLIFDWLPSTDEESGIKYYKYYLFDTLTPSNYLVNGTTTSTSVTLPDLRYELEDQHMYKLKVVAYNNYNLSTSSTSPYVLYGDKIVPEPLEPILVGNNNTIASPTYVDSTETNNTLILLSGEESLDCIWSFYDVDFAFPTGNGFRNNCIPLPSENGNYTCNITPIDEGHQTVHIACKDSANNLQTSSSNLDFSFVKESKPPRLNITYPEPNQVVSGSSVQGVFDVKEISSFNYSYKFTQEGSVIGENTFYSNNDNYTSDENVGTLQTNNLTLYGITGNVRLYVNATDSFNRTNETYVDFIVTKDAPQIDNNLKSNYINESTDINLKLTLWEYFSYNITDENGTLIPTYNDSNTSIDLVNLSNYIINLNITDFTDGIYYLNLYANNTDEEGSQAPFNDSIELLVDTIKPVGYEASKTITPDIIFESDDVTVSTVFKDLNGFSEVLLYFNDGTSNSSTIAYPSPEEDNTIEYHATIPSSNLKINQTFILIWSVKDMAGNKLIYPFGSFFVDNTPPSITTNNLSTGTLNTNYLDVIYFNDPDASQNETTNFNCSATNLHSGLNITTDTTESCTISGIPTEPGTKNVTFTVTDYLNGTPLDSTSKNITLNILDSVNYTLNIDTYHNVDITFTTSDGINYSTTATSSQDGENVSINLPLNKIIDMYLKTTDFSLFAPNISLDENISLYYKGLFDWSTLEWGEDLLGINNYNKPLKAKILELNTDSNIKRTYTVGMRYSDVNLSPSTLKIFKYYYDKNLNEPIYDDNESIGLVSSYLDGDFIKTEVQNFSIFVLTGNGPQCSDGIDNDGDGLRDLDDPGCEGDPNNDDESSDYVPPAPTGPSGGGGGAFGGLPPGPTCDDGIQNGDELGIDCGGACEPCPTNQTYTPPTEDEDKDEAIEVVTTTPTEPEVITKTETKVIVETVMPIFIWLVLVAVLAGAGYFIYHIYSTDEKKIHKLSEEKMKLSEESKSLLNEDLHLVGDYVKMALAKGFARDVIKKQLLKNGYLSQNIDAVFDVVTAEEKVISAVKYFNEYIPQGYTVDEIKDWLKENGIDENIIQKAAEKVQNNSFK